MLNSKKLVKIKSSIESKMSAAPGRVRTHDQKVAMLLYQNLDERKYKQKVSRYSIEYSYS